MEKPAPTKSSRDIASIAAEALEDDEEDAEAEGDFRSDFIRTRYAEERERFRGTPNDNQRVDEMAFQFIMKEFVLKRQELERILGEK